MMRANVKGFDELSRKLKKINEAAPALVGNVIKKGGLRIVAQAKRNAVVDTGGLRSSIFFEQLDALSIHIVVNAAHAPYIEFGTGKYVSVPAELQNYAAGFKGKKGGSFEEMVKHILAWMKRKGIKPIEEQQYDPESGYVRTPRKKKKSQKESQLKGLAYVIAAKLLREGIKPKPFFYPAFFQERPKILAEVEQVIKKLLA